MTIALNTVRYSVAPIADPRDLAARAAAADAQRRRDRLFQPGTRVWVAYRLDHQPHPYQSLYSPQQRAPFDQVCRYDCPGFTTDYYDVDTDRVIDVAYHIVTDAGGKTRRVLAEDMRCVEIEAPAATVPATIPATCRALMLVEPVRQVFMRLVAHVALIVRSANRSLYAAAGALHVGQHATLTPTPRGVLVDNAVYPVRVSLASLRRLVKAVRARFQAAEAVRFFADLAHECRALPGLAASLIPRDGLITVTSNRYPRLAITVNGTVTLAPHISSFQRADDRRPAWFKQYDFQPAATDLHAQIAARLQQV